ncbi:MAG: hypothetical protein HOW97_37550 [Catenulispora sp.]|nr:hypothetical protein [Catenulispora sp.]
MKSEHGRLLTVGVVAMTTCWAVAGPAPGAATAQAGTATPDHHGCVTVDFIEPTPSFYSNIPMTPQAPYTVGFQGAAFDTIYDAAGNKIATSVVASDNVFKRDSDGHVFEVVDEVMNFPDGTLDGHIVADRNAVAAGSWVSGRIQGISGRYAGLAGPWRWRLNVVAPPYPAHETGVLCPHSDDDDSGS